MMESLNDAINLINYVYFTNSLSYVNINNMIQQEV